MLRSTSDAGGTGHDEKRGHGDFSLMTDSRTGCDADSPGVADGAWGVKVRSSSGTGGLNSGSNNLGVSARFAAPSGSALQCL